jgi:hypothetical protein
MLAITSKWKESCDINLIFVCYVHVCLELPKYLQEQSFLPRARLLRYSLKQSKKSSWLEALDTIGDYSK